MKTALVTGSSRGIGRAIAIALHGAGYRVIINYLHSKESAETLAQELGTVAICADVSNPEAVADMFAQIGEVDVLVNNAGICNYDLLSDTDFATWNKLFRTNVDGVYHCTQCATKHMLAQKSGVIINLSSICGEVGSSYEVAYSATKGAISAFTKALAKELGPSGIRVNAIAPGFIETDMTKNCSTVETDFMIDRTALCRTGKVADIANLAVFLASDNSSFITGQVITCDGSLIL